MTATSADINNCYSNALREIVLFSPRDKCSLIIVFIEYFLPSISLLYLLYSVSTKTGDKEEVKFLSIYKYKS